MPEVAGTLIVGGGIAGLALAGALHRRGLECEVVERSATWPAIGAGITLHGNAVRAARALGIAEPIDPGAAALPRWSFADEHGNVLCETDLEALWGDVGPCLGITRVRLQYGFAGVGSEPFDDPLAGRLERFRDRFAGFGGPVRAFLAALDAYVARRRPRVEWVQEQSRVAARGWVLPPEVRNAALRERGDEMLRARYAPLVAAP